MSLIQLYVKYRDTDEHWQGFCISCGTRIHGSKANGGHFISRMFKSTCIRVENINMQCQTCNYIMGPWRHTDPDLADRLESKYRENLIIKYWIEIVLDLEIMRDRESRCPWLVKNDVDFIKEEIVTYKELIEEEKKKKVRR
jgi:hypothetical protein